ncbi:MAG: FAD-binding protein [Planctomycetota bacterium]|nr:MAG: FAD-binding protein [Planctomycetota bacterium]
MSAYGSVTPALIDTLRAVVGPDHVLTDPEELAVLGRDFTEDLQGRPDVAVAPGCTAEVAEVLRLASRERVPVVARGGGTGLSGGAVPLEGGIVLSTRRMNRILEIDRENLFAVVQPGVITQTLQDAVEEFGLFYPPDPASKGSCAIGGNVAECAGGPRCVKYGITRDYVTGLEAVLPSGEVLRVGGKLLKDVTGYDLVGLLVGSEGTLAVVTEVTLKLIPLPRRVRTLMAPFPSLEAAASAVGGIFQAGIVPSCCELLARAALRVAEEHVGRNFPNEVREAEATLLLEVDGQREEDVDRDAMALGELCLQLGADDVLLAQSPAHARELWAIRRAMGEAVKAQGPYREYDVSVPRARIPEALRAIDEVTARHGVRHLSYGHAGDGNLHVNVLRDGLSPERWEAVLAACGPEIIRRIVALGGTISGEHGIGCVQRELMPLRLGPAELRLCRAIKQAFDPQGILNPGKLLPDEAPAS